MSNQWIGQGGGYETRANPACSRCGRPMERIPGEGCPAFHCRACAQRTATRERQHQCPTCGRSVCADGVKCVTCMIAADRELDRRRALRVRLSVIALVAAVVLLATLAAVCGAPPACDLDGDGRCTLADYAIFQAAWVVEPGPTASPAPTASPNPTASPSPTSTPSANEEPSALLAPSCADERALPVPTPKPLASYTHNLTVAPGAVLVLTETRSLASGTRVATSGSGEPRGTIRLVPSAPYDASQPPAVLRAWADNVMIEHVVIEGPGPGVDGLGSDHIIRDVTFRGPGDGLVYAEVRRPPTNARILVQRCTFDGVAMGMYAGGRHITIDECTMRTWGHSIRWWGVRDSVIQGTTLTERMNKNAIKLHALEASGGVLVRDCVINGHTRAVAIGPQWDGAIERVDDVAVCDCTFAGSATMAQAIWIAAYGVVVERCKGVGWTLTPTGAVLVDPLGGWSGMSGAVRVSGCGVDADRRVVK